ncbi:MAG: hypothetical protein V1696_02315 [Candidatus Jorgensenbacteria bacterium]
MQSTFRFHWISRTAWRSLSSAAAVAAAGALLAAPPFAWWRFFAAAAVVAAVYWITLRGVVKRSSTTPLRGAGRGVRAFWVLMGLAAVVAVVLFSPALAPLIVFSCGTFVLLLGLLAFLSVGDACALFGAGSVAGGVLSAALTFSSAFIYFALLVPLISFPSFLFLLTLGLFSALALLAGETFAVSGGFSPRIALLGGGAVGLLGVEIAILLTFLSLGSLALALLFSLIMFFIVWATVAAGRGKFNSRLALRGIALFLALAALILAF